MLKYMLVFGALPTCSTICFIGAAWASRRQWRTSSSYGDFNKYRNIKDDLEGLGAMFALLSVALIGGFGFAA